jgi:hypothetical protein
MFDAKNKLISSTTVKAEYEVSSDFDWGFVALMTTTTTCYTFIDAQGYQYLNINYPKNVSFATKEEAQKAIEAAKNLNNPDQKIEAV